jgi:hypothetical protein
MAWLPFEDEAIARASRRSFAGATPPVAEPEDLLIYKLVAARPHDLQDAEQLLVLHGSGMNLERVRAIIDQFCEVLEDRTRRKTLESLPQRTGPIADTIACASSVASATSGHAPSGASSERTCSRPAGGSCSEKATRL